MISKKKKAFSDGNHKFQRFFRPKKATSPSQKNTVGGQKRKSRGHCPPAGDAPAWKPHITRITRKATTALLQCRQIVGKTW